MSSKPPSPQAPNRPRAFERLSRALARGLDLISSAKPRLLEAVAAGDEALFEQSLAKLSRSGPFEANEALIAAFRLPNDPQRFFARLLSAGALPNPILPDGFPLICEAALDPPDRLWRLEALLSAGANVELSDPSGRSALALAAANANVSACQSLIQAGCPLNSMDANGATPLIHALRPTPTQERKDRLLFEALRQAGSDPRPGRERPCFEALLLAGADPDLGRDSHGDPALILLMDDRDAASAERLINAGADMDCLLSPAPRHFPLIKSQRAFREPFILMARSRQERRQIDSALAAEPASAASSPALAPPPDLARASRSLKKSL